MHRRVLTAQLGVRFLMITLALLSASCSTNETSPDAKLTNVVRSTLTGKWQRSLSSDEIRNPSLVNSEEARVQIERVTQLTVSCFRHYAASYDEADIQSFETLVSQYADAFEIPDWEDRLVNVIDARYGPGASLSRSSCVKADTASRECAIAKSYEVAGGILLWKFAHCAVESINTRAKTGATQ